MSDKPITKIAISTNTDEEENLQDKMFTKLDTNLNSGTKGANVYLWYKREDGDPITRIQMSYDEIMFESLTDSRFKRIEKNLNEGNTYASKIYIWYSRQKSEYDVPIVDLSVTTSADQEGEKFKFGWERMSCDTNYYAGGDWVHIWCKRKEKTYICDLYSSCNFSIEKDLFEKGFIRVDQNTNRGNGGNWVFLWYRQSTDKSKAITDVDVSTDDREYEELSGDGYTHLDVNLNDGAGGNRIYAWYKRAKSKPIQGFTVVTNPDAERAYMKAGLYFIKKNLNMGNRGSALYIAYSSEP